MRAANDSSLDDLIQTIPGSVTDNSIAAAEEERDLVIDEEMDLRPPEPSAAQEPPKGDDQHRGADPASFTRSFLAV